MFERLKRAHKYDHITPNQYTYPYGAQIRRDLLDLNLSGRDYGIEGIKALALEGNERILVVGSGDGYAETRLRIDCEHKGEIIALDIPTDEYDFGARYFLADETIRAAGKQPFGKVQGTAEALPFENNSFDVIIYDHMLYHSPDAYQALMEGKRVGKRTAKILARSNGKNNKVKHHQMLADMSELLDSSNPRPFSTRLNMRKLLRVGNLAFSPLQRVIQYDSLVIRTPQEKDLFLASIDSYRPNFFPAVELCDWQRARHEAVEIPVDRDIENHGAFLDSIERGGAVWRNDKVVNYLADVALRSSLRPITLAEMK